MVLDAYERGEFICISTHLLPVYFVYMPFLPAVHGKPLGSGRLLAHNRDQFDHHEFLNENPSRPTRCPRTLH